MMTWVASNLTKLFIAAASLMSLICGGIGIALTGAIGAFAAPIAWVVFMGIPTLLLDLLQKKATATAPLAPEASHVYEYKQENASCFQTA